MNYDYGQRGYLLPEGCKDLIDLLKLQAQQNALMHSQTQVPVGEVLIPEPCTVLQLAAILKQKPFHIIADLMALGIFANVHQVVDFNTIAKVARKYGLAARQLDLSKD